MVLRTLFLEQCISIRAILAIKEKYEDLKFSFSKVSLSNLQNELKGLDCSKSVQKTDIPTKVQKEKMDICYLSS